MKKLVLLFLFVFVGVKAQDSKTLFDTASSLYKEGSYDKAIAIYKGLIEKDEVSSELYYNLGNCFYKLNKVAPAIYNLEKSLQLNPTNEDAKNNLIFAKRLTIDRIEELPKSVFQRLNTSFFSKFHYNTWGVFTVLFAFLAVSLFLLFYYSYTSSYKRLFFVFSVLSVVLLLSSFTIGFQQYNQEKNTKEAIVFTEEISVQSEPTNTGSEAFVLHEGTKVFVIDAVDEWSKIKLANGKLGWLKSENVKLLN